MWLQRLCTLMQLEVAFHRGWKWRRSVPQAGRCTRIPKMMRIPPKCRSLATKRLEGTSKYLVLGQESLYLRGHAQNPPRGPGSG